MAEDRRTFLKFASSIPLLNMFSGKVPDAAGVEAITEATEYFSDKEESSSSDCPLSPGCIKNGCDGSAESCMKLNRESQGHD